MASITQQFTYGGNTYTYYDVSSATQSQNAGLTFCYLFSLQETLKTLVGDDAYKNLLSLTNEIAKANATSFIRTMQTQLGDDTLVDDKTLYGALGFLNNLQRENRRTTYLDFSRACEKALEAYKILQSYAWGQTNNPPPWAQPYNLMIGNMDSTSENTLNLIGERPGQQNLYFGWEPEDTIFYSADVLRDDTIFKLKNFCITTSASPGVLMDKLFMAISQSINVVQDLPTAITSLQLSLPRCGQSYQFMLALTRGLEDSKINAIQQSLKTFDIDLTGNLSSIGLVNDWPASQQDMQWSYFVDFANNCPQLLNLILKMGDQNNTRFLSHAAQILIQKKTISYDIDAGNTSSWSDSFGDFMNALNVSSNKQPVFKVRFSRDLINWTTTFPMGVGGSQYTFDIPQRGPAITVNTFGQFENCQELSLIFDDCVLSDAEIFQITSDLGNLQHYATSLKKFTLWIRGSSAVAGANPGASGSNFNLTSISNVISSATSLEGLDLILEGTSSLPMLITWNSFYSSLILAPTMKILKIGTGVSTTAQRAIQGLASALTSTTLVNLQELSLDSNNNNPSDWGAFPQVLAKTPNIAKLRAYASAASGNMTFIPAIATLNLIEFDCDLQQTTDDDETALQAAIGNWTNLLKFKASSGRAAPATAPVVSYTDAFLSRQGLDLDIKITLAGPWASDVTNSLSARLLLAVCSAVSAKICVSGGNLQTANSELLATQQQIQTGWSNLTLLQISSSTMDSQGIEMITNVLPYQKKLKVCDITSVESALGQSALTLTMATGWGLTHAMNPELSNMNFALSPTLSASMFANAFQPTTDLSNVISFSMDMTGYIPTDMSQVPIMASFIKRLGQLSNLGLKIQAFPDPLGTFRMQSLPPVIAQGTLVRLSLQIRGLNPPQFGQEFMDSMADAIVSNRLLEELTYDISSSTISVSPFTRMYTAFKQLSYLNINVNGTQLVDADLIKLAQWSIDGFRAKKKIINLDLRSTELSPSGISTIQGYMSGMNTLFPQWNTVFITS